MIEKVCLEELKNITSFNEKMSNVEIANEISRVADKTRIVIQRMKDPEQQFPEECPVNDRYQFRENIGWTEGFWTGINWLLTEVSDEKLFAEVAKKADKNFVYRIKNHIVTDHHDLGFLFSLSTVAEYKITGNSEMREASLLAADCLLARYWEKAGVIQAWGNPNDLTQQGRMIMDCCMNLPLLYWASEETGDLKYRHAAERHIENASNYLVREDASTFHTFYMDVETGLPKFGSTHQGYRDDSCWARGQAWGVYGFALSARYLNKPEYFELAKKLANYFLNRLPEDLVCYWDLDLDGVAERDTSSMTIVICGLLEMLDQSWFTAEERQLYQKVVDALINALQSYRTTKEDGFLTESVYNFPKKNGVKVSCIWGDYYYLEALVRLTKQPVLFW